MHLLPRHRSFVGMTVMRWQSGTKIVMRWKSFALAAGVRARRVSRHMHRRRARAPHSYPRKVARRKKRTEARRYDLLLSIILLLPCRLGKEREEDQYSHHQHTHNNNCRNGSILL